jgi:hypothetical protein
MLARRLKRRRSVAAMNAWRAVRRPSTKAKGADGDRKHVVDVCPENGSPGTKPLYSQSLPTIHVNRHIL